MEVALNVKAGESKTLRTARRGQRTCQEVQAGGAQRTDQWAGPGRPRPGRGMRLRVFCSKAPRHHGEASGADLAGGQFGLNGGKASEF